MKNYDGTHRIETSGYKSKAHYTNPDFLNIIALGADTLATFNMTCQVATTPPANAQMWEGRDSTTIVHLPPEWDKRRAEKIVLISGKIVGISFNMNTLNGTRIKDFYTNDQLAITFLGHNELISAFVFQPISTHQLKLFTILSSLPYSYFCGPNY